MGDEGDVTLTVGYKVDKVIDKGVRRKRYPLLTDRTSVGLCVTDTVSSTSHIYPHLLLTYGFDEISMIVKLL